MKTFYILFIFLFTAAITSCNSGIDQNAKPITSVQSANSLINLPANNATQLVNFTDTNKPSVITPLSNSVNTALNPAHGQPGHRCDLTEGAPSSNPTANKSLSNLITDATPATLQPQNPTLNNLQPQLPTSTSKSTGVVNPAHGQPGHRCDLTVGAPLSTPVKNNITPPVNTNTTAPIPQNPVIYNPQPQSTAPASKATTGVNPAHGQPGHRCDLTVGAPLNSKPTSSTIPPVTSSTTPTNSNITVDQPAVSSPAPLQVNATKPIQSSPFNVSSPQSTTSSQNSKVRLNPAHGQPGHDCTIQAGKPLKQ
jgi:hypothetical protein